MRKIISATVIAALIFTGCDSKKGGGADQSTPAGTANLIFDAAKSGDYGKLKGVCDASMEPDNDTKMICNVPDGDDKLKNSFKEYFSKGKVVGEATIEGDNAEVKILFGPEGTKEETFNMKKKDGKWFLVSF